MTKLAKHHRGSSSSKDAGDEEDSVGCLFHLSTIEVTDRLNAMLETERRPHFQCSDYLSSSSVSSSRKSNRLSQRSSQRALLTPTSRSKIVSWLYDCTAYLSLQRECVAIAMGYVDRFMSIEPRNQRRKAVVNKKRKLAAHENVSKGVLATRNNALNDATAYQLVAVSALLLAAKQVHRHAIPNVSTLVQVSHNNYTPEEIVSMERILLSGLHWHLCGPTSLEFAYYVTALLARVVDDRKKDIIASVIEHARLQIEYSISNYNLSVLCGPSAIALAAVLNSVDSSDFVTSKEKQNFGRLLLSTTGMDVRSEEVEEVRIVLRHVLDARQSSSRDLTSGVRASSSLMTTPKSSNKKSSRSATSSSKRATVSISEFTPHSSTDSSGGSGKHNASRRTKKGNSSRRRPHPSPTNVAINFERLQLEP